jgi:phage terminase large subunit-like protein
VLRRLGPSAGPADLTAFSLYWPDTGALRVWAFLPAAGIDAKAKEDRAPYLQWQSAGFLVAIPGRAIDRTWLGAWIARETEGLNLRGIATDRWGLEGLKTELEREGINLPWEPHGAGFKDVSPSLAAFERLILDSKLQHGGNGLLRWAASNPVVDVDPAGNRKLSKQRSRGRIDPIVSALYAVGLAAKQPAQPDYGFTGMLLVG